MKLPAFDYVAPASLSEALAALRNNEDAKVLSGGQSLMPMLAFRLLAPKLLVDLRHIGGLSDILIDGMGVHLGARVRWCDILEDDRLATAQPLLRAAIGHVAHYQIRNRGTVGGSLAHADPAAELPAIAVACDAVVEIAAASGTRRVPARDFFTGPMSTGLAEDEIIFALHFPPWPEGRRWGFREFSRRSGDFALAGIGLFFDMADRRNANSHIAVFGVGDAAARLPEAEAALDGAVLDVAAIAARTAEVSGDIHASAAYRRALIETMTERALADALARRDH
ncbi:xanthine dehydrogenase family protein subunit M [Aquabacter sp. CN5-332]|uniref:FAD binding domain-containing protein n=1 Tax=Aquabacter sp. CN5-332 TaxID=3156608 RepID=UPI0032B49067